MSFLESLRQDKYSVRSQGSEVREQGQDILIPTVRLGEGETLRILVPLLSSVLGILCGIRNLDKGPENMISSSVCYLRDLNTMSFLVSRPQLPF